MEKLVPISKERGNNSFTDNRFFKGSIAIKGKTSIVIIIKIICAILIVPEKTCLKYFSGSPSYCISPGNGANPTINPIIAPTMKSLRVVCIFLGSKLAPFCIFIGINNNHFILSR